MRCRPGDLAVVIAARNQCNLGLIVRVIRLDDGAWLRMEGQGTVWLVQSTAPLTWCQQLGQRWKFWRRKRGPVPDRQLQPLRGERAGPGAGLVSGLEQQTGATASRPDIERTEA
jgi:hypothetical protein